MNKGINCTPYFAVFGREAYNGLEMDSRINGLSSEDFGKIKTTTQLFTILGMLQNAEDEKELDLLDDIDEAVAMEAVIGRELVPEVSERVEEAEVAERVEEV